MPILYINGNVTKLLSWEGVLSRSYFDNYSSPDIMYELEDNLRVIFFNISV